MAVQPNSVSLGSFRPTTTSGEYNNVSFAIRQALAKMQTATLVEVMACSNDGGLSPVGTVDIRPMVNQIDGSNPPNPTPFVTIYDVPYMRIQGGSNAVIIDPQVGDIGIAVFASRDISKVQSTKAQANPGSYRQYDLGDALYVGGLLNGTPLQYIQFTDAGISIVSPTAITLTAPLITIDGALAQTGGNATMSGSLVTTGTVTAEGTNLHTHTHGGVSTGSGVTGEPV